MKVSLQELRNMGIFEEIQPPKTVYHMTDRRNLESILKDGKIKPYEDYVTFFFPSLKDIPIYIELTGANNGRKYYDFDGNIHRAEPLNHEETIILKLRPRGRQDMEWYREVINETNRTFKDDTQRRLWEYMNNARICHYGAMRFQDNPEIIELTTVDAMPEPEELKEIRSLKAQNG